MRYLAIDVGAKRTGLAVGDDATRIVTPLEVIATANPAERWRAIERAVDEHGPKALVVGLPVNMDGTPARGADLIRKFAEELRRRLRLPVHLFDERLTSYAADAQMSQTGLTHKGKRQRRDALAAAAILRDFLAAGPRSNDE